MRPTESEPDLGAPRDVEKGFQPDELSKHAESLAEWGHRGWQRVLDWQEKELTIVGCSSTPVK
jgi:hypothetical protein